ncbi:Ni/Fe hydrogenase subunit alpha [candidate division BRC1 bacterium HGW-BRC1-1]|jgi:NAD-reducing hydrogenase large subunit|nr:MAG: Ni/Fe hydrogenase subunit alpha [candidate division BRC1 bacterium HGW-BRC1-1]
MAKTITIDPVTRIEGHAKITIHVDDKGEVEDARFHITQFRGFEKLSEGRPFAEMPSLMARICGICPVSHLVASAKACDDLLAVDIPQTGANLRAIMNLAQLVQSHALSFFHLSSPDLLMGMDAAPASRNILGVAEQNPQLALDGVRLRKFGQEIIATLGGKRIHPAWIVPGGVNAPLTEAHRTEILSGIPAALEMAQRAIDWYKSIADRYREEQTTFGNFPSLFMGMVSPDGGLDHYDGKLRIVDAAGNIIADQLDPKKYADYMAEATEDDTYLKSVYYKPIGYPEGSYRVGPLARLNVASYAGTPRADAEMRLFKKIQRGAVLSSFFYHYARLIEIMYGIERIEELLNDPDILSTHVRAHASPNRLEGIGMAEAPRGMLMHHYKIDENGIMEWANLIIATGHNNMAMNRSVLQVAKHFVDGNKLEEGMLNRVEAVIRTYDPCLSCSTHAAGKMPLHVRLVGPDGALLDEKRRD